MKKSLKVLPICALSLVAISSFNIGLLAKRNSFVPVHAASKVPTEIDLNDCDEKTIRDYYGNLNSLSDTEKSGTNLLKNLKPILKNGQQCYSYGSSATTQVWQAYEIVDRDWKLSPAEQIEGYNKSTNTITGYKYGKSASEPGSNPYIHALYVNRDKENGSKAWGDHSQTNYGINQEHVWPKSAGFDDDNNPEGARGDLMHLWAGNGKVNGAYHNNYYYGFVNKNKTYKDAGSDYEYLKGNLLGYSSTFASSDVSVFEPQDSDKGDIARCIFYMMARYNYLANDGDTINSSNPNLEIVNDVTSFVKTGYTSSQTTTGKMGILQDLLEWNKIDPVDSFEIHRNNLLYRNFSFNRNPFIDFPQWADYIWGTCENGNYKSSPTGSANPTSDAIAKGDEPIKTRTNDFKFDWKIIAIIAAVAVVVIIVLVIIFVNANKRGKKKMLKTAKKVIKKSAKSSSKKKSLNR